MKITFITWSLTLSAVLLNWKPLLAAAEENLTNLQKLVEELQLRNPHKSRPVTDHGDNVTVSMALAPRRIMLNDERQEMAMEAWTFMSWTDAHLTWSPSSYNGADRVNLDPADLWLPDIAVYNSASDSKEKLFSDVPVLVTSSGEVLWFPPTYITVPCTLDLELWPSDSHNCSINVGSWTHHGAQVDLKIMTNNSGVILDNYISGTSWRLLNHSGQRHVMEVGGNQHVDVEFTFKVERQAGSLASYITTSTLVVIVCVLASYSLPATQLLARLLLHLFALSMLIGCDFVLFMSLPSNGGPLPHVVKYYNGSLFLSTASLLVTLWLYSFTRPSQGIAGLYTAITRSRKTTGRYSHLQNAEDTVQQQIQGDNHISPSANANQEQTVVNMTSPTSLSVASNATNVAAAPNNNYIVTSEAVAKRNDLEKIKHEMLLQSHKTKIRVLNFAGFLLFCVAFVIEYVVLKVTIGS